MEKERNVALCLVFFVITCGIYGIYWLVVLADEMNYAVPPQKQGTSGGVTLLLIIVTISLYGLYWSYKMGEQVNYLNLEETEKTVPLLYLALYFFGLWFINLALIQSELNRYNRQKPGGYTKSRVIVSRINPEDMAAHREGDNQ